PSRPGASASDPRTTAAPPAGRVATAPVLTDTDVLWPFTPTETSPDWPLAVETEPSGETDTGPGHTTVASVSRVSAGCWVRSWTGGCRTRASTPIESSGITRARTLTASSFGVRRRRTTSATRTRR